MLLAQVNPKSLDHTVMPPGPQTSFALYDRLSADLSKSEARGTPIYALVVPDIGVVEDLALAPRTARFLSLNDQSCNTECLNEFRELEAVWLHAPTSRQLRDLSQLPKLRALRLVALRKIEVDPLAGHRSLEHLQLDWGNHIKTLSFLGSLPALRTLYLNSLKRLDLNTLPELPSLTALDLGGGMWSVLKVPSFSPLRRLPALRHLSLSSIRPLDGQLDPLLHLVHLETLFFPNTFEVEQHAALAARFPSIDSPSLRPLFSEPRSDSNGQPVYPCERCSGSRVMLTGRPARLLCPTCDESRIAKRVARWEIAYASASRGVV